VTGDLVCALVFLRGEVELRGEPAEQARPKCVRLLGRQGVKGGLEQLDELHVHSTGRLHPGEATAETECRARHALWGPESMRQPARLLERHLGCVGGRSAPLGVPECQQYVAAALEADARVELEGLEGTFVVLHRVLERKAPVGVLGGGKRVVAGLVDVLAGPGSLVEVVRKFGQPIARTLVVQRLQRLADPAMQLHAAPAPQLGVELLANQGVPERERTGVACNRRDDPGPDRLVDRIEQVRQRGVGCCGHDVESKLTAGDSSDL
jgi:hypothetical protein